MKKRFGKKILIFSLALSLGIASSPFIYKKNPMEKAEAIDHWGNFCSFNQWMTCIGGFFGVATGIYSLVKGENDNTAEMLEQLIETVNVINQKVTVINDKMDGMLSTLTSEFSQIKTAFSEMKVRDDLYYISKFNPTIYQNYMTNLESFVNKEFLNLSNYSTYSYPEYYTFEEGYIIDLGEGSGQNIRIKGEDVKQAVAASSTYSVDTQYDWFIEVADTVYEKYVSSETLFTSSGLSQAMIDRREYGFGDTDFKDAFSKGFYNFVYMDYIKKIIKNDNYGTLFVNNVKDAFIAYCNDLGNGSDSPLLRQYDVFTNLFCFQKDSYYINEKGEKRNLALDIGYSYIFNLLRFAGFAGQIVELSGSYSSNQIYSLMETTRSTINFLTNLMKKFYKVDENGKPYDNYCYSTKTPVVVADNYLSVDKDNYISVGISSDRVDVDDDGVGYQFGDLVLNEDSRYPVRMDGDQLTYLYIMYNKMPVFIGSDKLSFTDYLSNTLNKQITSNLYLGSSGTSNFNVSENDHIMNVYTFGQNEKNYVYNNSPDWLSANEIIINDTGYNGQGALNKDDYIYHQEVRGDYFDLSTGQAVYDESLYSVGVYYDSNTHIDDLGFFSSTTVAGQINQYHFDPSIYGGTVGNIAYHDSVATLTVSSSVGSDTKWVTFDIDIDYNFQSLNCVTNAKYGEVKLDDSPFNSCFSKQDANAIDEAVEKINRTRSPEKQIPSYEKMSNNSKYWVGYYATFSDEKSQKCKDYLYDRYLPNNDNLEILYNRYTVWDDFIKSTYPSLVEEPSEESPIFTDIPLDEEELETTTSSVLQTLEQLNNLGIRDIHIPDDASDFKFMATVEGQCGDDLYVMSDGKVAVSQISNYVIKAYMKYVSIDGVHFVELPEEVNYLIDTKNIELNLPLDLKDESKNCVSFTLHNRVSSWGSDPTTLYAKISQKDDLYYTKLKIPYFGAYKFSYFTEYETKSFDVVPGQSPTCEGSGFKAAYKDLNGEYYSEPGQKIGDGSKAAYDNWCLIGNPGYIAPHGHIYNSAGSYSFNQSKNEFTGELKCSICGKVSTDPFTAEGTFVEDVAATCEEASKGHYVGFYDNDGERIFLSTPAGEYSYGDPLGHQVIHVDGIPATCERPGIMEHYRCTECGLNFKDEGCTIKLDDVTIPAKHHEHLEYHEGVPATETNPGNRAYYYCHDCGCFFLDPECEIKVSCTDVVLPQINYEYIRVPQVLPTHYTSGHKTYYYCPQNGKHYLDDAGYEEIEDFESWINEGGLGYIEKEECSFDGPISYTMNGDQCTASRQCSYPGCKEVEQETVTAEFIIDTAATCTTNALGHYAAKFENEEFGAYATPANSVEMKDSALGHDLTNITCIWEGKTCVVSGTCSHCGETVTLYKEGTLVIDTPATCTADAIGHYEAAFNIGGLGKQSSQSFAIENTALGHLYEDGECIRCHHKDSNYTLQENNKNMTIGLIVSCTLGGVALATATGLGITLYLSKKKKRIK